MTAAELVAQHFPDARRNGKGWKAPCPSHPDKNPSLSIDIGDDGRVLLHCFSGCAPEAIVAKLGLTMRDLMPMNSFPRCPAPRPAAPRVTFPTAEAAIADLEKRLGPRAAAWHYSNADGEHVGGVVRWNLPDGTKEIRPVARVEGGRWVIGAMTKLRPLYRLPAISGASQVYIVEGERCADAAAELGIVATTSAGGAQAAASSEWRPLAGKHVVAIPDNDAAGDKYIGDVQRLATEAGAASVRIIRLPDLAEGGDIVDFVAARRAAGADDDAIRAELETLVNAAETAPAPAPTAQTKPDATEGDEDGSKRKRSQTEKLLELADDLELFHSADAAYARVPVGGHFENHLIGGRTFATWLRGRYYREHGGAPRGESLTEALGVLRARAIFDGPECPTAVRLAAHDDAIFLNLADSEWQAVRIDKSGWRVVEDAPVRFIRPHGVLALPAPVEGGDLGELRGLVNIPDDDAWALTLAWLVAALRPAGPFPILCVTGEQGSAKSTLCRILRALLDPNSAPLRSAPREDRDLMIAAANAWIVGFDNLSGLPRWLSDALCRLSTGGGFATRELYTDDGERIFDAMRPILANGIEGIATRSDLADRAVSIALPTIPEHQRRTESDVFQRFATARPRLLGALLDAVVEALRNVENVQLDRLPRMADFACWAVAGEAGLGLRPGAFMAAYDVNRAAGHEAALDSSPIGPALISLLAERGEWSGTASDLLRDLCDDKHSNAAARKAREWPTKASRAAGELRRIAPNLRATGWTLEFDRAADRNRTRIITIYRAEPESSCETPSAASEPSAIGPDDLENAVSVRTAGPDDRPQPSACRPAEIGPGAIENAVSDSADGADGISRLLTAPSEAVELETFEI